MEATIWIVTAALIICLANLIGYVLEDSLGDPEEPFSVIDFMFIVNLVLAFVLYMVVIYLLQNFK